MDAESPRGRGVDGHAEGAVQLSALPLMRLIWLTLVCGEYIIRVLSRLVRGTTSIPRALNIPMKALRLLCFVFSELLLY